MGKRQWNTCTWQQLSYGIGVEEHEYNACVYYQQSAKVSTWQLFFTGIGVEKDEHKAFAIKISRDKKR